MNSGDLALLMWCIAGLLTWHIAIFQLGHYFGLRYAQKTVVKKGKK